MSYQATIRYPDGKSVIYPSLNDNNMVTAIDTAVYLETKEGRNIRKAESIEILLNYTPNTTQDTDNKPTTYYTTHGEQIGIKENYHC